MADASKFQTHFAFRVNFQFLDRSTSLATLIFLPKGTAVSLRSPEPCCASIFAVSKARVAEASANLLWLLDILLGTRLSQSALSIKQSQIISLQVMNPQATFL